MAAKIRKGDKVVVTWSTAPGAKRYELWRSDGETTPRQKLGEPTGTSFSDTTPEPCKVYWYWVRAWNDNGFSPFSYPDSGYRGGTLGQVDKTKVKFQVANVKIKQSLVGAKGLTSVRVGFSTLRFGRPSMNVTLAVGQQGCFLLTSHHKQAFKQLSPAHREVVVPWRVIDGAESARAFAAELADIVSRAMAPSRFERYPNAGELYEDLIQFLYSSGRRVGAHDEQSVARPPVPTAGPLSAAPRSAAMMAAMRSPLSSTTALTKPSSGRCCTALSRRCCSRPGSWRSASWSADF